MNTYDIGDRIRIGNPMYRAADNTPLADSPEPFRNNGVAVNPDTVTIRIRRPDSTVTEAPPTQDTDPLNNNAPITGRYYLDVTLDQAGYWHYTLAGTGAATTAESGRFLVRPDPTR